MRRTLTFAAAATLAVLSTQAAAETRTLEVSYADLALDTPEGLATLERRIDRAVREVCGYREFETGTHLRDPSVDACMTKAKAAAAEHLSVLVQREARGG